MDFLVLKKPGIHASTVIHDSVTDDALAGLYWCLRRRTDCRKQWEDRAGIREETLQAARGGRHTMAYHSPTDTHADAHSSKPIKMYLCNMLPALSKVHK